MCSALFSLFPYYLCTCDAETVPSEVLVQKLKEFEVSNDQAREIMKLLLDNIERGLKKSTHDSAIVKSFVTYVQDLPTGNEKGKFLGLDLGGSKFRVLSIELGENHHCEMKNEVFVIPEEIMTGTGEELFDHIVACMAEFAKKENINFEKLPLGFTFSFPLVQVGLTKGILERWTKGFNVTDVIGHDVVQLLMNSLVKRDDLNIDVTAILNDTTGTLMSSAWLRPNCKVGLIVGTGFNCCYVEDQKNAELFDEPNNGSGKVVINTESGAFGDDGALNFIRTEFDRQMDAATINPGKQIHEKLVSGMYLGEIVRLVLEKFTQEGHLFQGKGSTELSTKDSFETTFISEIEAEEPCVYDRCKEILNSLGLTHATEQDYVNVRYVCEMVSTRAATIVSACMATLLNKMTDPDVTIAVDGSVYRLHPHFHNRMMKTIGELAHPHIKFDIMLSEDGSGRGAAIVAAVAAEHARKSFNQTTNRPDPSRPVCTRCQALNAPQQ